MEIESNQIELELNTISATVSTKAKDSRCRHWCKIIRAGQPLPFPVDVDGANDLPGAYIKGGSEELFPGDYLIHGEERHHKKIRGWDYWLYTYHKSGVAVSLDISGDMKAFIKERIQAGRVNLDMNILKGAGEIAAAVRVIHYRRARDAAKLHPLTSAKEGDSADCTSLDVLSVPHTDPLLPK